MDEIAALVGAAKAIGFGGLGLTIGLLWNRDLIKQRDALALEVKDLNATIRALIERSAKE